MAANEPHLFEGTLSWGGQPAGVTFDYEHYNRLTELRFEGAIVSASSPSAFFGDDSRMNPETFMLASLMQCHFLTFMSICARSRVPIAEYADRGTATLAMKDGKMRFVDVLLRPVVKPLNPLDADKLAALHDKAHAHCFMANSVNFPVRHEATVTAA